MRRNQKVSSYWVHRARNRKNTTDQAPSVIEMRSDQASTLSRHTPDDQVGLFDGIELNTAGRKGLVLDISQRDCHEGRVDADSQRLASLGVDIQEYGAAARFRRNIAELLRQFPHQAFID